jgi:alpha-tubulin suppressor-like RCC1 family protein
MALTKKGEAWCWGRNGNGQIGNGTRQQRDTPTLVLSEVCAISSGWYHNFALTQNNKVLGWGTNEDGQLGDGTRKHRDRPAAVKVRDTRLRLIPFQTGGRAMGFAELERAIREFGRLSLGL